MVSGFDTVNRFAAEIFDIQDSGVDAYFEGFIVYLRFLYLPRLYFRSNYLDGTGFVCCYPVRSFICKSGRPRERQGRQNNRLRDDNADVDSISQ